MRSILLSTLNWLELQALSEVRDNAWKATVRGSRPERRAFQRMTEVDAELARRCWSGRGGTSEPAPQQWTCTAAELRAARELVKRDAALEVA